ARLDPRDAEELHDRLLELGVLRPEPAWADWFEALVADGRAARLVGSTGPFWLAVEQRPLVEALFPDQPVEPDGQLPEALAAPPRPDDEAAAVAVVRGHLSCLGPTTADELAARLALPRLTVEAALARLEAEGFVLRGHFDPGRSQAPDGPPVEFCERRLLARIHRYPTSQLRRELEPVTAQDFVRFLLRWQHATPDLRREGRRGLLAVIEQLQGFEIAAGSWEESVFPARVTGYRPEWLDELCLSGEVAWARL